MYGMREDNPSFGAIAIVMGGALLGGFLFHGLPKLGVSSETTSLCGLITIGVSFVLAIVVYLRHKYLNP